MYSPQQKYVLLLKDELVPLLVVVVVRFAPDAADVASCCAWWDVLVQLALAAAPPAGTLQCGGRCVVRTARVFLLFRQGPCSGRQRCLSKCSRSRFRRRDSRHSREVCFWA